MKLDSTSPVVRPFRSSHYQLIIHHLFAQVPSVAAKIITQRLAAIVSTDNTILCLDVGGRKEKQETPKSAVKLKEMTSRSWNVCQCSRGHAHQIRRDSINQIEAIAHFCHRAFTLTAVMKELVPAAQKTAVKRI